jgi:hypothetical protein
MATIRELADMLAAYMRAIRAGNPPVEGGAVALRAAVLVAEGRVGIRQPVAWTRFERFGVEAPTDIRTHHLSVRMGIPLDLARQVMREAYEGNEIWVNSRYQVLIRRDQDPMWVSVRRLDQEQIHSWRDLQRIKNELIGRENEAVEIYPAEARHVDQANQYHLWVFTDPKYRVPFGFAARDVREPGSLGIGEHQAEFEA